MGKKIMLVLAVVAVLALAGGGAMFFLSAGGPKKLFTELMAKESVASDAYGSKDFGTAKVLYTEVKTLIENLEQKYADSPQVASREFLQVKDRCNGRLASMASAADTVKMMFELMKREEGRQYLEYWDFEAIGQKILPGRWDGMSQKQRDEVQKMAESMVDNALKQNINSEMAKSVKFDVRDERLDGSVAYVGVMLKVATFQTEITLETTNTTGVWKVFDFTSTMASTQQGLTHYLAVAFDTILASKSIDDFLSSPTREQDIEEALTVAASEELQKFQTSKKGQMVRVKEPTQIMSGNQAMVNVAPGEIFEVIRDQEDENGRWYLVSFLRPDTKTQEMGWLLSTYTEDVTTGGDGSEEDAALTPPPVP